VAIAPTVSTATKNSGIYLIRNIKNGKFYIGSAVNFKNRWRNHRHKLRLNIHENLHLQRAWNQCGEQSFKFEIDMECSIDKLLQVEQVYLDIYVGRPECYNIAKDVYCPMRGKKLTKSHRKALILSNTGRIKSNNERKKISDSLKGRKITWITKIKKTIHNSKAFILSDSNLSIARGIYQSYSITTKSLATLFGVSASYMAKLLYYDSLRQDCIPNLDFDKNLLFKLKFRNSKLMLADIVEIRKLRSAKIPLIDIAKKYNINTSTVSNIANNKLWVI